MSKLGIKDIVENDYCIGCGICVSESKSSKMIWNEHGFLVPDLNGSFNEKAIKVCPFNPTPDEDVKDEDKLADIFFNETPKSDKRIGKFENLYVGYSTAHREKTSSGGIATFIFEKLLIENVVDNLFIVKEVNGSYAYQWFDNVEAIQEISKTRYIPVTLENLFKEIDKKEGRVAVSGVACFIKAIRLKQHYNPKYKQKIAFLVGIICGGIKSSFFTDYLAQKSGINGKYSKQEYRIKDPNSTAIDYSFGAFDDTEKFHQLKMKSVGDMWGTGLFKSNACDFCDDVTTELADISLGDAWLNPYRQDGKGTSIIITRTPFAEELVKSGILSAELVASELSLDSLKESQAGSFKHRQMGLSYRLNKTKKNNSIIPFKRQRLLESIPREFKIVQNQRMQIRKQSLELWKKSPFIMEFEKDISIYKKALSHDSKWYHRIQNFKRKLGLKTLDNEK